MGRKPFSKNWVSKQHLLRYGYGKKGTSKHITVSTFCCNSPRSTYFRGSPTLEKEHLCLWSANAISLELHGAAELHWNSPPKSRPSPVPPPVPPAVRLQLVQLPAPSSWLWDFMGWGYLQFTISYNKWYIKFIYIYIVRTNIIWPQNPLLMDNIF